jgi:hypothetical protein
VGVAIAEAEVQQPDDGPMGDARVWRVAVTRSGSDNNFY